MHDAVRTTTSPLSHHNHIGTLKPINGMALSGVEEFAYLAGLDYTVSNEMPYRCIPDISMTVRCAARSFR